LYNALQVEETLRIARNGTENDVKADGIVGDSSAELGQREEFRQFAGTTIAQIYCD
jgi:hypothetical protein